MVSNDARNNLMILFLVISVGFMVFYFMFSFSATMKQAADYSGKVVNETAANVTKTFSQVVSLITQQNQLQQMEQNESKTNLKVFLSTFANQSADQVSATKHLEENVTAALKNQTQIFINTLLKSQALTIDLKNSTDKRNIIMEDLITVLANQTANITGKPVENITGQLIPKLNQTTTTTNNN